MGIQDRDYMRAAPLTSRQGSSPSIAAAKPRPSAFALIFGLAIWAALGWGAWKLVTLVFA